MRMFSRAVRMGRRWGFWKLKPMVVLYMGLVAHQLASTSRRRFAHWFRLAVATWQA